MLPPPVTTVNTNGEMPPDAHDSPNVLFDSLSRGAVHGAEVHGWRGRFALGGVGVEAEVTEVGFVEVHFVGMDYGLTSFTDSAGVLVAEADCWSSLRSSLMWKRIPRKSVSPSSRHH